MNYTSTSILAHRGGRRDHRVRPGSWSLAAATPAPADLGGIVVGGGLSVSATELMVEIALLVTVLAVMVQVTRNPGRLLPAPHAGLRYFNRLRILQPAVPAAR